MNRSTKPSGSQHVILRYATVRAIALMCTPFLLVFVIGYLNFGLSFFSIKHWLNSNGILIKAWFGIPIFLGMLALVIYKSIDILLSKGTLLYTSEEYLFIGRRAFLLTDMGVNSTRLGGMGNKILLIPRKDGSEVEVPLLFAKVPTKEIVKFVVSEVTRATR